jgi:putative addiction module component (TIGR02574 family)
MSQHPPAGLLADALRLPAEDRLALASELLDSVEGAADPEWDDAWLAELDRRNAASKAESLEDWATVRARVLSGIRGK